MPFTSLPHSTYVHVLSVTAAAAAAAAVDALDDLTGLELTLWHAADARRLEVVVFRLNTP